MSRIDDLMADLQSEGTVDSHGGFTLDREKAREKMRQFQLADPREYLLQLVRAAHCQGATHIDIDVDADDMYLRFDGTMFEERDFEELYDALFGRADDPTMAGRRHLALGLNAAIGLDPRRITVHSGAAQLTVVPDGDDDFGPLETPIAGTLVHARDRVRFANVFRFFQGLSGSLPEASLVRERCGYSTIRIRVNGERLPSGRDRIQARAAAFHAVSRKDSWAYGGPTQPGKPGVVHIIAGGVRVTTVELPGAVGFIGAAGSPHIRTDVSQADVIRDGRFEQVMACAREAQVGALTALLRDGDAELFLDPALAADRWPSIDADYGPAMANALRRRVHAETLAGDTVSLADLDGATPVECVTFDFAARRVALGAVPADLADLLILPDDGAFAAAVADVKVDRTPDLLAWIERAEGERAFRRRRVDTLQLHGDYAVKTQIMAGDWRGEAGISEGESGRAWITWVHEGCALSTDRVDLKVPGLRVMITGPLTPTPDFRGPQTDAAFEAATGVMSEAVERLMNTLPHSDWGRSVALQWLCTALDGHPRQRVAERLRGVFASGSTDWLRALPSSTSMLARMPLFPTMHGVHRSLVELATRIKAHGFVDFVAPVVRGPRVDPPILSLDEASQTLLEVIFGDARVRSGSKRLGRARKRAEFEERPARPLDLSFETAKIVGQVEFEGGVVGLRQRANAAAKKGWFEARVQPFSRGRPLRVVSLALPLPGIVGAVEVGDRALNARYDGLREPAHAWLVTQLVPHLDALFSPGMPVGPARRFFRALIDLWVPTEAHHAAWYRFNDPAAYRRALRCWWASGDAQLEAAMADWSAADVPDAPVDPFREAILAPLLAIPDDAAPRALPACLLAAFPRLCGLRLLRGFDGPDASIDSVVAGVESDGVVLHASRVSVFPEGFGGVRLKTEHAQLERVTRLVGPDGVARATTWKVESALAAAVEQAPRDPGALPANARGVVPIEAGQIGLCAPFDPHQTSAVQVVIAGRVVAVLEPATKVAIVGRVAPTDEARVVLARGQLDVDRLTRVRIDDQATRAVDAAIRAVMAEPADAERDRLLLGILGARAQGVSQRAMLRDDPVARALTTMPLFGRLVGPPVSAEALIDHRRSRRPLWVTNDPDAPPPSDPSQWVLLLAPETPEALKHLFSTEISPYAEALAERAALKAFEERPLAPWGLPDAAHVVEVTDGPIRALVGHGMQTDHLTVLREGRLLGETSLELGIDGFGGMVDDAALPATPDWASNPRLRRLRRLVASGVLAVGAQLTAANAPAAQSLIWALLRRAWPSTEWVALYRWLHLEHAPDEALRLYHDALQAAAQGTRYLLDRVLGDTAGRHPCSTHGLMYTFGLPSSSGGDRMLRAAVGGDWPLDGDLSAPPLSRLATRLGTLGTTAWIQGRDGEWRSMAEVARLDQFDAADGTPKAGAGLLEAILDASAALRRAAERQRAAERERQAVEAREAAQAVRRAVKKARQRAEVERRQAAREAEIRAAQARAAQAHAEEVADATPQPEPPTPAEPARQPQVDPRSTPTPATAPKPPEARLVDRILRRLSAVQADHPQLLADVNLARLSLRTHGPLAVADDHVFAINGTHPTAAAALAGDPVAELMVVAAAYGALNAWLVEITDAHELQFVQHLLDLAARAPNGEAAAH